MPFQPIRYSNLTPMGLPWARNFAQNVMQGQQMGRNPSLMQEQQAQNLANIDQMQQGNEFTRQVNPALVNLKNIESEQAREAGLADIGYKQAQAREANARADIGGMTPTGSVGEAESLWQVGMRHGFDSPRYKNAERNYNANLEGKETYNALRPKLAATTPMKTIMEINDLQNISKDPSVPNNVKKIAKQQERVLRLNQRKDNVSERVAEKIDASINIETSLEAAPVDYLLPFVGPGGKKKWVDSKAEALRGYPSQEYLRAESALTALEMATHQSSVFYNTPANLKARQDIQHLMNPDSWTISQPAFKAKYNTSTGLLRKEARTFNDQQISSVKEINEETGYKPVPGRGAQYETEDPDGILERTANGQKPLPQRKDMRTIIQEEKGQKEDYSKTGGFSPIPDKLKPWEIKKAVRYDLKKGKRL